MSIQALSSSPPALDIQTPRWWRYVIGHATAAATRTKSDIKASASVWSGLRFESSYLHLVEKQRKERNSGNMTRSLPLRRLEKKEVQVASTAGSVVVHAPYHRGRMELFPHLSIVRFFSRLIIWSYSIKQIGRCFASLRRTRPDTDVTSLFQVHPVLQRLAHWVHWFFDLLICSHWLRQFSRAILM